MGGHVDQGQRCVWMCWRVTLYVVVEAHPLLKRKGWSICSCDACSCPVCECTYFFLYFSLSESPVFTYVTVLHTAVCFVFTFESIFHFNVWVVILHTQPQTIWTPSMLSFETILRINLILMYLFKAEATKQPGWDFPLIITTQGAYHFQTKFEFFIDMRYRWNHWEMYCLTMCPWLEELLNPSKTNEGSRLNL